MKLQPRETVSARKRRAIVEAATHLFVEKGYAETSMDEIAAAAAVSKPTVYNHFADKRDLFAAIVRETVSDVDTVVATVTKSFETIQDVDSALNHLATIFLNALLKPDLIRLRRLVIGTADEFPDVAKSWYEAGFSRVLDSLGDGFRGLHRKGLLTVENPLTAANHFVGLLLWIPLNQALFAVRTDALSRAEVERHAKSAVRAFLTGYQGSVRRTRQRSRHVE